MKTAKDKNGKEIKIGDKVLWEYNDDEQDTGVITDIYGNGSILCKWSDSYECTCSPCNCTVIQEKEESVKTTEPEEFTTEDQEQLDTLLAKQWQWICTREKAMIAREALVDTLYEMADKLELGKYVNTHIDTICATLLTYEKYKG